MFIDEFPAFLMRVRVHDTRESMGKEAAIECAKCINSLLEKKSEINMIFAAAPSQNEFLANLIKQDVDFSRINAFHMDEYIGLPYGAAQTFGKYLFDHIFSHVNFKSVNYIDSTATNIENECIRYAELIKNNRPDIVCMGIGENGHIAFNDPGTKMADFVDPFTVKKVELDDVCRQQQVNDGCFESIDLVPKYSITLTIPTLIKTDYIFCMVPAKSKAEAVYKTVKNSITVECPSTILRKHANANMYLDADSASLVYDVENKKRL